MKGFTSMAYLILLALSFIFLLSTVFAMTYESSGNPKGTLAISILGIIGSIIGLSILYLNFQTVQSYDNPVVIMIGIIILMGASSFLILEWR